MTDFPPSDHFQNLLECKLFMKIIIIDLDLYNSVPLQKVTRKCDSRDFCVDLVPFNFPLNGSTEFLHDEPLVKINGANTRSADDVNVKSYDVIGFVIT